MHRIEPGPRAEQFSAARLRAGASAFPFSAIDGGGQASHPCQTAAHGIDRNHHASAVAQALGARHERKGLLPLGAAIRKFSFRPDILAGSRTLEGAAGQAHSNFHSCQFPFLYVINPKSGAGAAFNLPLSGRLSPTEILKHRRIKLSLNIILNSRVPPAGGGAVGKEPDAVDRLESGGGGLLSCAFGEEFRRRSVARDGWLCRTAADGAGGREPDRCGARRAQPGAQGDEVFARDQPP